MRYLISAHGCYRKREKVPLYNVRLEFHSAENEYVEYSNAYLKTFCSKSINKRNKAYKPVRKVDRHYYEMEFGRNAEDTFSSFIFCCTTGEYLYDFNYGDLLLSDVIDIVKKHAELRNNDKWIYLSMLTCNDVCVDKVNPNEKEVGVVLHREQSFNNINANSRKNAQKSTRNSSLFTRKGNMMRLPYSERSRKHILKIGNTVKHKTTGLFTVIQSKEHKKAIKQDPEQVFFPNMNIGDQVMYKSDLWMIVDFGKGNHFIVQHIKTGEIENVEARQLIKIEFN